MIEVPETFWCGTFAASTQFLVTPLENKSNKPSFAMSEPKDDATNPFSPKNTIKPTIEQLIADFLTEIEKKRKIRDLAC